MVELVHQICAWCNQVLVKKSISCDDCSTVSEPNHYCTPDCLLEHSAAHH
ncbi:MAG: hypothetical protein ACW981_17035 [Candidatus Hodarchaeales archaeon]